LKVQWLAIRTVGNAARRLAKCVVDAGRRLQIGRIAAPGLHGMTMLLRCDISTFPDRFLVFIVCFFGVPSW